MTVWQINRYLSVWPSLIEFVSAHAVDNVALVYKSDIKYAIDLLYCQDSISSHLTCLRNVFFSRIICKQMGRVSERSERTKKC